MTTTAGRDVDIESAVIPLDFNQDSILAISIVSISARLIRALRNLRSSLSVLKVVKFSVGMVVGILSLTSAWWALDLAMWTAVKDFREDCREQLQNFNITSPKCQEVLARPLREPPTWRGYLEQASRTVTGKTGYMKMGDYSLGHGNGTVDKVVRDSRRFSASAPAKSSTPVQFYELDDYSNPFPIGIRKQGDSALMYGPAPWLDITLFLPLSEDLRDARDEFWLSYPLDYPCEAWFNMTVTGTVERTQIYNIPDQKKDPEGFERSTQAMPPELQIRTREMCVYPDVPPSSSTMNPLELWRQSPSSRDFGAFLAASIFFIVVMAHEVFYGGFARRTRWKWQ